MEGKQVVKLAAELAAGVITADYISSLYGKGVLAQVLGIGAGTASSSVVGSMLDAVDRETGIVSDLGSLVDDVFSIF